MSITEYKSMLVRLLFDNIREPCRHFAVEEAILRLVNEGTSPPTLRIRRFEPSVWIGVNQYPEVEVNLEFCKKKALKIIRRPNPGGAVYQDEGSFCYSFFFKTQEFFEHLKINNPSDLYKIFGDAVIEVCKKYGVKAEITGRNDVSINNRKVYGSAQLEFYDSFVHSGSFLVNVDVVAMAQALNPSKLKFVDKGYKNIKDGVVNLAEVINKGISVEEVIETFIEKVALQLRVTFSKREKELLQQEKNLAEDLYLNKYSKKDWTFREKETGDIITSTRTKSGIITVTIKFSENKIKNISITGDFLLPNQSILNEIIKQINGKTKKEALMKIKSSGLPKDIIDVVIEALKQGK